MAGTIVGLLFFLCSTTHVWSRNSPNADEVKEWLGQQPGPVRYSDNILEDSQLDVPGLISKYRYPVEVHNVVTDDGYVLELHRIPHGRDENNVPDSNKPVVLVMHGLFSSSADFVVMGPGTALAYELAECGFDVWLGNARGNFYSRKHLTLDPDDKKTSFDFWNFSWEHIGTNDLPAMIDHILAVTGQEKLHYVGHSQGTTAFFSMAALRPEYNDKVLTMQALAPVAYLQYSKHPLINAVAPFTTQLELLLRVLGIHELLTKEKYSNGIGAEYCQDGADTQEMCSNLLFLFAGRSEDMHNATMLPLKMAHVPAGASVRQLVHYGQLAGNDYFRRYNYGRIRNLATYKSTTPPLIDLSKITSPVYLHYCETDLFADLLDVFRLAREISNLRGLYRVPHDTFSHLDFMWGTRAIDLVYRPMIHLMKEHK